MAEPFRQESPVPLRPETLSSREEIQPRVIAGRPGPEYRTYRVLQAAFVFIPIVAGLDKFFHLLTDWNRYLTPAVPNLIGISSQTFMQGAGVVEIIAGLGIAFKPKIFGYIVSLWLLAIIVNLVAQGQFLDIALRDLGLSLAAYGLARLSQKYDRAV